MSGSPPTTLGKYQIIREIARSNDIVYEAWDPLMSRRVAVKELAMPTGSSSQQQEDRINRFRREARAAGSLTHPNIMTVFEVGEEGGRHFIAMEYLDGHTLRNEVDTKGFLPYDKAVSITADVLKGLSYAHEHGVIHRDIKPDNIQILSDGRIKITDFGIARLTFEPNLTQDGQVFGTPSYMSPEQIVGREIDARSDIFSVGVMLYEMLSGQKPFSGDSVVAITYAIMNKEPDQPPQANYAIWQVIKKAIDKSPQLRYSNAVEMVSAIEAAITSVQPDGVISPPTQLGGTVFPNAQGLPPIVNPYAQPGGAYGSVPHYMPPAQAYSPQPVYPQPPAPTYNYSPYAQPGAGAVPPHTPGYTQPPSNAVYYPPPPRKPLLSPEARYYLGRFLLGVVVCGAIIGAVIGLINVLSSAARSAAAPISRDPHLEQAQKELNSQDNGPDKEAAAKELAKQQVQTAKGQITTNNLSEAISNLKRALDNDPESIEAYVSLGEAYERDADSAPNDVDRKVDRLRLAAEQFGQAADRTIDPSQSAGYRKKAVSVMIAASDLRAGNASRQRELLYVARELAGNNKELKDTVEGAITRVR